MLADQLDYVVGVDPHRDLHALAVVHVLSGAVVLEATAPQVVRVTRVRCSSSTRTLWVDARSRSKGAARSVRV